MKKVSIQPPEEAQAPARGVVVGDHVYFHHEEHGPLSGEVAAFGKHGCTVRHEKGDGGMFRVPWEHMLGHKARKPQRYMVVDEGEDGMIAQGEDGKPVFIGNQREDDMSKALLLLKAGEGSTKNNPRVHLDPAKHRYVLNMPDQKTGREPGQQEPEHGPHNVKPGEHVHFVAGAFAGKGEVTAAGKDGAHVKDGQGREHKIHWHEVTGKHDPTAAPQGEQPAATKDEKSARLLQESDVKAKPNAEPVDPEKFDAATWAKAQDDAAVTPESVLSEFPPDTAAKMAELDRQIEEAGQTIHKYRISGKDEDAEYEEARKDLQGKILFGSFTDKEGKVHPGILDPDKMAAAKPPEGEAPTFTMLGGRGGSGKSWFSGQVYDPTKAIVLDADEIKQRLPEYAGWNAAQVHEESSDLLEWALRYCREKGVNVVCDATIKTSKSAEKKAKAFKEAGYKFSLHYMHLPRSDAAKRAVARFLSPTGRYVPPKVVLGNTTNEESFNALKGMADEWSFRDNNVARGEQPKLIASIGKKLVKAIRTGILLLWNGGKRNEGRSQDREACRAKPG